MLTLWAGPFFCHGHIVNKAGRGLLIDIKALEQVIIDKKCCLFY